MSRLFLFVAVAFAASCAMADARDSLVHWWKAKDLNNDGLLQPTELCDMMTVSSNMPLKASEILQDTTSEMAEPASIGTGVVHPAMRRAAAYDSDTYFSFNNPTNYDSEGKLIANWQSITLPNKASVAISQDALEGTFIARFKWHGLRARKRQMISGAWKTNYQYNVTLYANNYKNDSAIGWRVGLRMYDAGTSTMMYPTLLIGDGKIQNELHAFGANSSTLRVRAGEWYDYAVSFKQSEEAGKIKALFVLRCNYGTENRSHGVYEFTGTVTPKPVPDGWFPSYIGINGKTAFFDPVHGTSGTGRGEDSFGGDISDIKVYRRALTERQILSEFVDNPLCEVGRANESGNEFTDSDAAAVYDAATMPWSQMRKTLNAAHPSVSVKCDVVENGHGLGRLVELKVLKGNAAGSVEVAANGMAFGRKTVQEDGWLRFFIPARIMSALAKDAETGKYPLTLTFTRKGNLSGDMVVDFLRVGGAWQIGKADNSTDEFGTNDTPYYNYYYNVAQEDDKHITPSIGASGIYSSLAIFFPVGEWAASNLVHRLYIKGKGSNSNDVYIKLNDASETNTTIAAGTMSSGKTIEFAPGTLEAADNKLRVFKDESVSGWNAFDYWKFETVWTGSNYDTGTIIELK